MKRLAITPSLFLTVLFTLAVLLSLVFVTGRHIHAQENNDTCFPILSVSAEPDEQSVTSGEPFNIMVEVESLSLSVGASIITADTEYACQTEGTIQFRGNDNGTQTAVIPCFMPEEIPLESTVVLVGYPSQCDNRAEYEEQIEVRVEGAAEEDNTQGQNGTEGDIDTTSTDPGFSEESGNGTIDIGAAAANVVVSAIGGSGESSGTGDEESGGSDEQPDDENRDATPTDTPFRGGGGTDGMAFLNQLYNELQTHCGGTVSNANEACIDTMSLPLAGNLEANMKVVLKQSPNPPIAGHNPTGAIALQCVTLAKVYCYYDKGGQANCLSGYGAGASNWITNNPYGYTFYNKNVSSPQLGDFPIWDDGGNGHIAVVIGVVDSQRFEIMEFNYDGHGTINKRHITVSQPGLVGFLRAI